MYIPVTDTADPTNHDVTTVDSFSSFAIPASLSALNFLDQTIYNQWYTVVVGTTTVLVSNFIYKVSSIATAEAAASTLAGTVAGIDWNAAIAGTGDKLCYASTITTGNVPI